MHPKTDQQNTYCFTDKLRKQLEQIPHHPLTIVEAPSGFGKTTAIRQYLKEYISDGACEYWYTCLGESTSVAWKNICELLSDIDAEVADNLQKLEKPTMDTLMDIPAILRNLQCSNETYLVIDNFQLLNCDIPRELMSVLSMHDAPKLHLIFITQYLGPRSQITFHNADIHTIDAPAFFFDRESTAKLFRMQGVRLSKHELDGVFACTEGWVSAIRLQIINYKENGSFGYTVNIEHLVEIAIWNRLTPEEKDFFLSVSVFDSFCARQAAIMIGREALPETIEELLKSNDFIRYIPDKGIYIMHSILQEYLRNRFYHYKPEDFQNKILRLAGQSYVAVSQFFTAAQFFLKVKDFEAILSMPVDAEYIGNQKENCILEFIRELADQCPEKTLMKYPFAMLTFCSYMYAGGYFETYWKLRRLVGMVIETKENLTPKQLLHIKSEFALISLAEEYNDVKKMSSEEKKIWDAIDTPTHEIKRVIPFTFGCPSILFLFWRESGQLENALRNMTDALPKYCKLTKGHGTGADSVMWAEAMLMRGEDAEAEILCHKALYQARNCQHQQISICLSAELVLTRIAIMRGDVEGYFTAVRSIRNYANEKASQYVLRMVDLCLTAINLFIGNTESVALWIHDMESINKALYFPAIPYAQLLHCMLVNNGKHNNELVGLLQAIMDKEAKTDSNVRHMMPQIYYCMYFAMAKLRSGNLQEAKLYFNQALKISLSDKIHLPLVQNPHMFHMLIELADPSLLDKNGRDTLIELCRRQEQGVSTIKKAILKDQSPLTPREREVALLVKDRLSAQEIAEKLYISKATAKTIIRNLYSKLDIHSRSELKVIEV